MIENCKKESYCSVGQVILCDFVAAFWKQIKPQPSLKKYRKIDRYGDIRVVNRGKGMWAIIDDAGNEIVPFGKYSWIDGFAHELARIVGRFVKLVTLRF